MASEWTRVALSQIATPVLGGTPSRAVAEYWNGDIPWATAKDVARVKGRYLESVEEFITREGLENSAAKLLPKGTVIITARGTVGEVAQLGRDMAFNQTCYALLPSEKINNDFLFYALKGTLAEMKALTYGTVFETITTDTFSHWSIPLPPLPEQRAIAHILGTLDDKIELNRRMSETLEQMARALFKAWFVDFEPVRAKMEGRWRRGKSLPGLPAHLYDLFPDRLVPSELGEIPEGRREGTLGDLAEVTSGKRPDQTFTSPTPDASVPLWGGNGPMAYVRQPLFTEPILLTGRVGTLGSVFRISSPCWPSDNTLVVLPRKRLYMEYVYLFMKRIDFDSLNRGSTQPLLTQTDLKKQLLLIASDDVINEFHKITDSLFASIDATTRESCTLAALRDALLPKLIRGEVRVKDAEKFLKERGL